MIYTTDLKKITYSKIGNIYSDVDIYDILLGIRYDFSIRICGNPIYNFVFNESALYNYYNYYYNYYYYIGG